MKIPKVAVALSGGVDSGVAAKLLVDEGYQCSGFYLRFWKEEGKNDFENKCCDLKSLEAARKTCWQLGIPFYVLDFAEVFKKRVVEYFLEEYAKGKTPNPCVMCNKYIKFGRLLEYIRGLGFDYLATGHYARITRNSQPVTEKTVKLLESLTVKGLRVNYHLLQAKDKAKDQSYFLYNLTQKQLAHILFPIGEYTKKQVRAMAKKWQLPVAERPESQEVCFFSESDYRLFLRRQIPEKIIPGEVVDNKGEVIGRHFGLPLYTIGQRHGFEITVKKKSKNKGLIPPFYVIGKDVKKNQLIVGFGQETERKLFKLKNVNFIIETDFSPSEKFWIKIRNQGELLECQLKKGGEEWVEVILKEGQRGIAPGQAGVIYKKFKGEDFEVVGGGIII
ncbi:MAG: tRNA 2-thiouridine(34) synthase MnmA [Microgenomates group bacterium]